ncbi:MAG: hypothetical protein KatS3mg081_0974 [Gemmatimonadales bacterium]|nr:hypothetical protein HRbin33_00220 [bacterium HR33]GIW51619.1 MAG: hypothetical protein KatS3mg081_0974 [Gemmatimonadales bacterium]
MIHETVTSLEGAEVLERAKKFFAERIPHHAAFVEKEGPNFATFRGQGGEELAIAVFPGEGGTRVRASSLFYDQAIDRFFSTLPPARESAA